MSKRGYVSTFRIGIVILIILLLLATFIVYSIWFSTANAATLTQTEIDNAKIKKAYLWLESKTLSKWSLLTTEQEVFSFLALKENLAQLDIDSAINSIFAKSNNKKCWSKQSCNIKETSLAKIMLDSNSINADTENISNWLMLQNISISGIEWELQITPEENQKINCTISYNGNNYPVTIDEKNRFLQGAGNCLSVYNTYWLRLSPNCDNIPMNISCSDSAIVNFLLMKGNDFYVINNNVHLSPDTTGELKVDSYCLANPLKQCDYEGTLWAAYSFYLNNEQEKTKMLLPYLIIFSSLNEKYLPESFLYATTKRESYYNDLETIKGSDSLINLNLSAYNPYYDSSLAAFLTQGNSMIQMKDEILARQNTRGYWDSVSGDNQRETALILLGFFNTFQIRSECERNGFSCVSNCSLYSGTLTGDNCETGECCQTNLNCEDRNGECKTDCLSNETQVDYSCSSGICCKSSSLSLCTSEIGGEICLTNEQCLDSNNNLIGFTNSADERCCKGNCYEIPLRTCSELYGNSCSPENNQSCNNNNWFSNTESSDPFCCKEQCLQGLQSCSNYEGKICDATYSCKGAEPLIALDTNGQATCCVGSCVPSRCEDISGIPCIGEEQCSGQSIETYDSLKCCTSGECLTSCSKMEGNPCPESTKTCNGELKQSFDYSDCCIGECKEKAKAPWLIIFIALGVAIIALLIIFRKKLFKKKQEPRPNNIFSKPELPPQRPQTTSFQRPTQIQRPGGMQRPSLLKR